MAGPWSASLPAQRYERELGGGTVTGHACRGRSWRFAGETKAVRHADGTPPCPAVSGGAISRRGCGAAHAGYSPALLGRGMPVSQ